MIGNKKVLRGHVKAGDYFGTLATVLDLLRQSMEQKGFGRREAELLKEVREDLVYLQEGYKIVSEGPTKRDN